MGKVQGRFTKEAWYFHFTNSFRLTKLLFFVARLLYAEEELTNLLALAPDWLTKR